MQAITVELQKYFTYFPVILLIIVGLAGTLLILFLPKFKKKKPVPKPKPISPQNITVLKQKYIGILNDLEKKCREGKCSDRQALQALSKTVRNFVYDATGIRVQNYTLMEIHAAKVPRLYELISQCYIPEFAVDADADVYKLINKARTVIAEWN